jgi:hypothetical protein
MITVAGSLLTRSAFLAVSSISASASSSLWIDFLTAGKSHFRQEFGSSLLLSEDGAMKPDSLTEPKACDNYFGNDDEFYHFSSSKIREKVSCLIDQHPALAGPFIRLSFHDATTFEQSANSIATGGPNGSIRYELEWSENRALSKPLAKLEQVRTDTMKYFEKDRSELCRLSLADVIALAGAVAVEHAGGGHIAIRMGRQDSLQADPRQLRQPLKMATERSTVTSTLPSAGLDSDGLRLYFGTTKNLKEEEWVALCGVHGLGRHVTLLGMPKECLKNLTRSCLESAPQSVPLSPPL